MRRVVVAGGTGQTGRRVVDLLRRRGDTVRVLSRRPERARQSLGDPIEIHEGDVRDVSSLRGLARDASLAIVATGTRSYYGANGGAAVDAEGNRNLVEALSTVEHIVFLSAFGLDRKSIFLSAFSAALNGYFRWKAEAEMAFRQGAVPLTIVRPVELRNRAPRSPALLNQVEPLSLLRTVSRELVAEVLVHCCGHPEAMGKTFEVCEDPDAAPLDQQLQSLDVESGRGLPAKTPLF